MYQFLFPSTAMNFFKKHKRSVVSRSLTWKEQRIYRGQLKDLANILKENNLTLTTMIVVGEAIDNRHGLSKLYDGHFTHLFRKGKQ